MLNWDDYGKEENNTPATVNVSESVKEVQKVEAPAKPLMDTAAPVPTAPRNLPTHTLSNISSNLTNCLNNSSSQTAFPHTWTTIIADILFLVTLLKE